MLEAGMRQVEVARRLGVSQSVNYELGWHKPIARQIDVEVDALGLRRKPRIGSCICQP